MSYRGSEDLFLLIKSMTKAEKAFVGTYSCSSEKSELPVYLQLLRSIEKQKTYDEEKLSKAIGVTHPNRFSETKNYLYSYLLNLLSDYHKEDSVASRLANALLQIELLFNKGLYDSCAKVLRRFKSLAEKFETPVLLLELLKWESKLIWASVFAGSSMETIADIQKQEAKAIEVCNKISDWRFFSSRFYMQETTKGVSKDLSDVKLLEENFGEIIKKVNESSLSFSEKVEYYFCCNIYYSGKNNFRKAYDLNKKFLALYEEYPHQVIEQMRRYISVFNNLILAQFDLKKYEEVTQSIKKFREIPEAFNLGSKQLSGFIHAVSVTYHQFPYYIRTGQFTEGVAFSKNLEKEKGKLSLSEDQKITIHFCTGILYFGAGDFTSAKIRFNKILNEKIITRDDIYRFAKIMSAMVYFELKDEILLEHGLKSTQRFYQKKSKPFKFESVMMNFLKTNPPHKKTRKEQLAALKNLKDELVILMEDPFEKKVLEYFDFISWIDSKIENRSLEEVVKKNIPLSDTRPAFQSEKGSESEERNEKMI